VSVGEALSGVTLARRLKEAYPGRPLIVSTTTVTGQALARERMPFADAIIYFPLDWAFCVRRAPRCRAAFGRVGARDRNLAKLLRETGRRKIPVVFVSGRISDRSFARYQRYFGFFGFLLRPFLRNALSNTSAFLMQSAKDAERVRAFGAPADRVQVSGNLKYDLELPTPKPLSNWLATEIKRSGRSPIIVAGSVVATEEPHALIAFGTLQGEYPKSLLVLAPRKPECFDAAAEFIDESHRKFLRRSRLPIPGPASKQSDGNSNTATIPDDVTVLLLDSYR